MHFNVSIFFVVVEIIYVMTLLIILIIYINKCTFLLISYLSIIEELRNFYT